ncbi:MAG: NTP transferase domain-containing protein, partial [Methyloceanibacter sp.]
MTLCLIVIPARLKATRLPDKPLADIGGEPMIVHVWRRAVEADCGPVVVATDAAEVREAVERAGGEAVMTRPDHASGSDRVFEAVQAYDPAARLETVVNLQGDLPTLDPVLVRACLSARAEGGADIGTIAASIVRDEERTDPNVVKVIGTPLPGGATLRALYFTRATAPYGEGPLYHHIG